jgi:hypothetical protein
MTASSPSRRSAPTRGIVPRQPDAFVEHAFHVREARDTLFGDFAYDHQMTIYGEPVPRLVELFARVGVEVTWFTLLQALEPARVD